MPTEETSGAPPGADGTTIAQGALTQDPAGDRSSTQEWDGSDWTKLDTYDWWKQVPESARGHFTKADEERRAAKDRSDFLDRLFNADDDKLRQEHATVLKERDDLRTERDNLKQSLAGIEARAAQEAEDREWTRLETKFPDIWKDAPVDEKGELLPTGAFVRFLKLQQAGFDEDEAAEMVRARMKKEPAAEAAPAQPAAPPEKPPLPKTREVKAPPSIAHAGKGGNNPSSTVNMREAKETLDQRAARLEREYRAEEERAARG